MPHIVIGMPTVGNVDPRILQGFAGVVADATRCGTVGIATPIGLLPYDKARNAVFDAAIQMKADYLMSLDSDMILPLKLVSRLLEALQANRAQAASGYYLRRGFPFTCVWSAEPPNRRMMPVDAKEGIHTIKMTGFGCVLIDMNWVRENMKEPYCRCYEGEDGYWFIDDSSFFKQFHECGGKLVGVREVSCGHLWDPIVISEVNAQDLRASHMNELYPSPNLGTGAKEPQNGRWIEHRTKSESPAFS